MTLDQRLELLMWEVETDLKHRIDFHIAQFIRAEQVKEDIWMYRHFGIFPPFRGDGLSQAARKHLEYVSKMKELLFQMAGCTSV